MSADVDQILNEDLRRSHCWRRHGWSAGRQSVHSAEDRVALLESAVDPRQVGLQAGFDRRLTLLHLDGILIELGRQYREAAVH